MVFLIGEFSLRLLTEGLLTRKLRRYMVPELFGLILTPLVVGDFLINFEIPPTGFRRSRLNVSLNLFDMIYSFLNLCGATATLLIRG